MQNPAKRLRTETDDGSAARKRTRPNEDTLVKVEDEPFAEEEKWPDTPDLALDAASPQQDVSDEPQSGSVPPHRDVVAMSGAILRAGGRDFEVCRDPGSSESGMFYKRRFRSMYSP